MRRPRAAAFTSLDGDPRVFTIASWNKTSLDKSWQDLRDKRLLTFDQDKLLRVELTAKRPDHRIRQERAKRMADPEAAAPARG
jgi:hypothetical protein